ncbi:MAG: hypothetical protein GY863_24475 [bacterium]|nr:hypothetical protein [bacterium]
MRKAIIFLVIAVSYACTGSGISNGVNIEDSDLPVSYDLREAGILTPAKNQGNFGSCGAFAAVGVFEALIKQETGITVDLSEQHVVNCSPDWRSSGISSLDGLKFMKVNGIVLESALPYSAAKTESIPSTQPDFVLTEYYSEIVDDKPVEERVRLFKERIYEFGPVATTMNFYDTLREYAGGVYTVSTSAREVGGHWVVIVGWQDDASVKNGGYWICRNSSGPDWGEDGYFRIAYGESGIDDYYFCYGSYKID